VRLSRFRYAEGDRVPFGYGLAWYEYAENRIIVLPIPINIIAGLARRFYLWCCFPWRHCMTATERECFERGRQQGIIEERLASTHYVKFPPIQSAS
jgi:hypothetical protein